jgi:hypothetical protein
VYDSDWDNSIPEDFVQPIAASKFEINNFFAKTIYLHKMPLNNLLENQMGKCPILAIVNVLSLRNRITIPNNIDTIGTKFLFEMLESQITNRGSLELIFVKDYPTTTII